MIATLKIIPASLPGTIVEAAIAAAGGVPVFSFHPLTTRPFALIQTRMDGMKPALLTATEKVTKQRLDQLGCALVDSRVTDHDAASLEVAISEAVRHGAEAILICGASAIVTGATSSRWPSRRPAAACTGWACRRIPATC